MEGIKHCIARDQTVIEHCDPPKATILSATMYLEFKDFQKFLALLDPYLSIKLSSILVFLLFVHVFLLLPMYSYCCLCILIVVYVF